MIKQIRNKQGQLTLFIILGIVILVVVTAYVLLFSKYAVIDLFKDDVSDPRAFMTGCLTKDTENIVSTFIDNNLYTKPVETNYFKYNNNEVAENVPYMCKVGEFYSPCINQRPNLQGKLKEDLIKEIQPLVDSCWQRLISSNAGGGYTVQDTTEEIDLIPRQENLEILIPNTLTISSTDGAQTYSDFSLQVNSRIFQLAALASKITNFESTLCEFDATGWMLAYPNIVIKRFRAGDQTKVYTLKDRTTEEETKFAIRTCIIPAGI